MGLLNRFHVWFALGLRVADVFVMVATLFLLAGLYEIPWDQSYSLLAILSGMMVAMLGFLAEQLAYLRRIERPDLGARKVTPD